MSDPDRPEDGDPAAPAVAQRNAGEGEEVAFNLWLHRCLHQLYDAVAEEPIPEALLRLIEEDRKRR